VNAAEAFLAELIDDAGLFPPARLTPEDALAADKRARDGPWAGIVGKFVCPVSRLAELRRALDGAPAPPLSVILDGPLDEPGLLAKLGVTSVEARVAARGEHLDGESLKTMLDGLETLLPAGLRIYLEVPPLADVDGALAQLAAERARRFSRGFEICAKLRCGPGESGLPSVERVARFLAAAVRHGVALKATAGLHVPLAAREPGGVRHGFLNVCGAALLAYAHGLALAEVERIVAEDDPRAFALSAHRFAWRDRELDSEGVATGRAAAFHSFGSCSLDEPVEGLAALGLAAPGAV
jgi:hypothetical protein